jgi:hypothetical protein
MNEMARRLMSPTLVDSTRGQSFAGNSCPDDHGIPTRPYAGGPQIGIVTFTNPNPVPQAAADLFSGPLQFPAKFLMLASEGNAIVAGSQPPLLDSIMVHFTAIGNKYAGQPVTPSGLEPWIPVRFGSYTAVATTRECWYMRTKVPFKSFYIDYGAESAQIGDRCTFIYCNDTDGIDEIVFPFRNNGGNSVQ